MRERCTVYGLYDEREGPELIRYVGETQKTLCRRLGDHMAKASPTDSRPVLRWIHEVFEQGGAVRIRPIWQNAIKGVEERIAIEHLRLGGSVPLLNVEHNGEAKGAKMRQVLADPTLRARRSEAQSKCMTPERRAALSARMKGVPKSPEHRAKISAARKRIAATQKRGADGTYC